MAKLSDSDSVYYDATPRCEHCQGRRDERALLFVKMRMLRQKTREVLRKHAQLESAQSAQDGPVRDGTMLEPGMVDHMRLLNCLVTTVIKIVQETPIEHQEQEDCSTMTPFTPRHTTIH